MRRERWQHFKRGDRVRVISNIVKYQKFTGETGTVIHVGFRQFGIRVRLDRPIHSKDGHVFTEFSFNPGSLEKMEDE